MWRRSRLFTNSCAFLLMFMVGCSQVQLANDLSEEDVNEILVLLSDQGIAATKERVVRQNEIFYAVAVPKNEMSRARSLLVEHNLPRHKELGLTGVYKEKGLIPTPDEQKARYLLALKGEIINSLERIPDVIDADVVLNIPTPDEFASPGTKERQHPTASVVIRAKPNDTRDAPITEGKIQQFVANTVEGMNPRDVAVVISYLSGEDRKVAPQQTAGMTMGTETQEQLLGLTLDASSKDRLKVYLLLFFLILVLLAAALLVSIVQASRMRRSLAVLQGPGGGKPVVQATLPP